MENSLTNSIYQTEKEEFNLLLKPDLNQDYPDVLDSFKLYYSWKETLPNILKGYNIDMKRAMKWIESKYGELIINKQYMEKFGHRRTKSKTYSINYFIEPDILIEFNSEHERIIIYFQEKYSAEARHFMKNCPRKKTPVISNSLSVNLVTSSGGHLHLREIQVPKGKIDLSENYSDDFLPVHSLLLRELQSKSRSGIVLLHGKSGTGKSTYLNMLISKLKKDVIILSPRILNSLDHPDMVNTLTQFQDSILIVEDAEELITTRDTNRTSGIAWLLNLTDGLLGDSLKIKVICTFNTPLKNIDEALLRKGRLIARYEFKELSIEKSILLLKKLGVENPEVNSPMTLADIYHHKENNFSVQETKIGFRTNNK